MAKRAHYFGRFLTIQPSSAIANIIQDITLRLKRALLLRERETCAYNLSSHFNEACFSNKNILVYHIHRIKQMVCFQIQKYKLVDFLPLNVMCYLLSFLLSWPRNRVPSWRSQTRRVFASPQQTKMMFGCWLHRITTPLPYPVINQLINQSI